MKKLLNVFQNLVWEAVKIDSVKKKNPGDEYPETVAECIDDDMKYRHGVYEAMKDFRTNQPWRGTQAEMQFKFRNLNQKLAQIYEIDEPQLVFVEKFPMGACCFKSRPAVIMMEPESDGRYSVVCFLHEFAHAIGRDEKGACKWSLNLFKRIFPNSYNRLEPDGHVLKRKVQSEN